MLMSLVAPRGAVGCNQRRSEAPQSYGLTSLRMPAGKVLFASSRRDACRDGL